ncbi:MAG: MerR family transcriptional regulator, partial [Burkholderiales bacterium]
AAQVLVLYRFAASAVIRRLRVAGHEVARAPSDVAEIESLCRAMLRVPQARTTAVARSMRARTPAPARFDERALSEIAAASTTVYCECPRHLVELVLSLGSFERYSAECANRGPDDAALHRDLELTAATARQMMEDALVRVAVAEGFPVPPSAVHGS